MQRVSVDNNTQDGKNLFPSICSDEYDACFSYKSKNAHFNTLHKTLFRKRFNTLFHSAAKTGRSLNFTQVESGHFEHFQLCLSAVAKVKNKDRTLISILANGVSRVV